MGHHTIESELSNSEPVVLARQKFDLKKNNGYININESLFGEEN